jgi:hypothetical protein
MPDIIQWVMWFSNSVVGHSSLERMVGPIWLVQCLLPASCCWHRLWYRHRSHWKIQIKYCEYIYCSKTCLSRTFLQQFLFVCNKHVFGKYFRLVLHLKFDVLLYAKNFLTHIKKLQGCSIYTGFTTIDTFIPSQGHNGFHSFPVVDWFCLFIYLWVLTFPL